MGHGGKASKVTDKDHGFDAMLKRLDRAAVFGATLRVGIIEEDGGSDEHSNGLTIAEIGEFHEFGLGVPRRSFIADWADENEESHRAQVRKIAEAVVKGKIDSWEDGLERLGVLFQAQVQKRISDGIDPPLAESTIAKKGSSTPLVDIGLLKSAITYKVSK